MKLIDLLSNLTKVVQDSESRERTVQRVIMATTRGAEGDDTIAHLLLSFMILAWAIGCILFMGCYLYRFSLHYNREDEEEED